MSDKVLSYKRYQGSIEADLERKRLRGKVLHINGLVTYVANDIESLEREFQESVDDYLAFCKEEGLEPEKPYSGQFQLRVGPDMHRELAMKSAACGKKLNDYIVGCLHEKFEMDEMRQQIQKDFSKHLARMTTEQREFKITYPFGTSSDETFRLHSRSEATATAH